MTTGLVWHERYMWHDTGNGAGPLPAGGWVEPGAAAAESPPAKRRLKNLLDVSGLTGQLTVLTPRAATEEELAAVHTTGYIERIRALSAAGGGDAGDGATRFGADGYEIACLAAGGAITAIDALLDGRVNNCYALIRPPGHHATAEQGMGFCIFANCAIAVHHALSARGVSRAAVVDIDVHHGNGTQAAFYANRSVLTVSVHQDGVFPPNSGGHEERGEGDGLGFNINVPLPAGSGVGAYTAAFGKVVVPALDAFEPELIVVASGLDANGMDPLARQMLHSDGYRELTSRLMDVADRHAAGRVAFVHEGGYSPPVVPFCGLAIIETLSGIRTDVVDPFLPNIAWIPGQDLQPHQAAAIDRAADALPLPRGDAPAG